MLDVCRHFSDVASVIRLIYKLAFHKINRFHWHLQDSEREPLVWGVKYLRLSIKNYVQFLL